MVVMVVKTAMYVVQNCCFANQNILLFCRSRLLRLLFFAVLVAVAVAKAPYRAF